jgi:hypothetical protein
VTSRGGELGYWADLGDLAFSVEETEAGHYRVYDLAVPGRGGPLPGLRPRGPGERAGLRCRRESLRPADL